MAEWGRPLAIIRRMADWATISAMATAGGTLVLAIATFSSVRSSSRSARVAERSLLAAQRPILIPSREDDPDEQVRFVDGVVLRVPGHGCAVEVHDDSLFLAIGLRNGGAGLAVIHGWHVSFQNRPGAEPPLDPSTFRRQNRDLYIPAGSPGFWQGGIREDGDRDYEEVRRAAQSGTRMLVDLLYSDHEGGQRAVARFALSRALDDDDGEEGPLARAEVIRYRNVDRDDPR